ncbi:glycosyltransferase family 2 protein [Magnetococcales bacterium HHB-1]
MINTSIVIPVFNAQNSLEPLLEQLIEHLEAVDSFFEILLVDDGSLDQSWEIISQWAEKDSRIKGILLMHNSGQGAATMAGLAHAKGDIIVTMDDDLQNPPHEVPNMLQYLIDHPQIDAVFGKPKIKKHSPWRRMGSFLVNTTSNLVFQQGKEFRLTSFRAMRRKVVLPLLRFNSPEPAIGALISTLTKRLANLEVDHQPRTEGKSGYSLPKLLRLTLSKFLGFSTFPLRFLAIFGLVGIILSVILGLFIFIRYLIGDITVPGWTTLTLLLIALSGFTFMAFGIIGEYLQQILICVRQDPSWVVRSRLNISHPHSEFKAIPDIRKTTLDRNHDETK